MCTDFGIRWFLVLARAYNPTHFAVISSQLPISLDNMTNYGLPYLLEDKTGSISGSEFRDLHDRMHLSLKPAQRDASHAAYLVYEWRNSTAANPTHHESTVCLDFGPHGALGTISIGAKGRHVPMGQFLSKVSSMGRYVYASQTYGHVLMNVFAVPKYASSQRVMDRYIHGAVSPHLANGSYVYLLLHLIRQMLTGCSV